MNSESGRFLLRIFHFVFRVRDCFCRISSLEVEKGKLVALVGESGSGKSTLVNILTRFYPPESGRIMVNSSIEAGRISLEKWHNSIGLIPQEVHLFNGTILENVIPEPMRKSWSGVKIDSRLRT